MVILLFSRCKYPYLQWLCSILYIKASNRLGGYPMCCLSLCPLQQDKATMIIEPTKPGPAPMKHLIRRKSALPQDFETTMALKNYHTVDTVLTTSKET